MYVERTAVGGVAELALGGYCAITVWLSWHQRDYALIPFMLLYACGFLTVGSLTVLQARGRRWWRHAP